MSYLISSINFLNEKFLPIENHQRHGRTDRSTAYWMEPRRRVLFSALPIARGPVHSAMRDHGREDSLVQFIERQQVPGLECEL